MLATRIDESNIHLVINITQESRKLSGVLWRIKRK